MKCVSCVSTGSICSGIQALLRNTLFSPHSYHSFHLSFSGMIAINEVLCRCMSVVYKCILQIILHTEHTFPLLGSQIQFYKL